MYTTTHIEDICRETDNEWFLTHAFPQLALYDLKFNVKMKTKNVNYSELECMCHIEKQGDCGKCAMELERTEYLKKLKINKMHCYDYVKEKYFNSRWIIPDKINGEIPGFMLLKCFDRTFEKDGLTHELIFACVRPSCRKKGILKNMVNSIPKEWNIWLEANSNEINDVEKIWEKCGFSYHTTIHNKHLIYKKMAF